MSPEPVNCTDSELSTYLQALEAGFLPTFYSDTSPFALSSSMSIASKSWRSGKKTGHFPGFPFLPMSASSTANPGADSLMSSPEGSLARTSAQQGVAPESTASDPAYGVKWRGSLARFDPDSRSWKTVQHSLIEDSDACSVTWPRSGMTVGGQCYLLPTLGRRTGANGSGLWPDGVTAFHTPNTTGLDGGSNSRAALKARRLWQTSVSDDSVNRTAGKFNSRGEPKLSAQVMLPTPSAGQCETRPAKTWNQKSQSGRSLGCMAATNMWPTPHGFSPDGRSNGPSGNEFGRAVNQSLAWPTPCADDTGHRTAKYAQGGTALSMQAGGSLNPTWVEWLMGWPLGWTDLKPSETGKCRSAQPKHGDC